MGPKGGVVCLGAANVRLMSSVHVSKATNGPGIAISTYIRRRVR